MTDNMEVDWTWTPLMAAASDDLTQDVHHLIAEGSNVNEKDSSGTINSLTRAEQGSIPLKKVQETVKTLKN